MRLGTTLLPQRITPLKNLLSYTTRVYPCVAEQVATAFRYYKNDGTPYNFDAPRCATCKKAKVDLEERKQLQKCSKCKTLYCNEEC